MAFNNPQMRSEGEGLVKRYVHSPLTNHHNGIQFQITPNGKVVLTKPAKSDGDVVEYDEIEIPASLVFKLATLLKATRNVEYVPLTEYAKNPGSEA